MGLFSRRKKSADLSEIPPEAAEIVEQITELFPDAVVSVNEPVEATLEEALEGLGAGGGRADRISQLERLAKLREQGVLTESEFQAEKARVLGQS